MRRPLLIGLIAGGLVVVILAVVGIVFALNAADRQSALTRYASASAELQDAVTDAEAAISEADQIVSLGADPLLPAAELSAVTEDRESAAASLTAGEELLGGDPESLPTGEVRQLGADILKASHDLASQDDEVLAALDDLLTATQTAATDVEAANFEAENAPHIAFRTAVEDLASASADSIAEYLSGYLDAAHALETSHAEEIAEKAGPLFDLRMAAEQFARSLSGGVLLDFDWAPVVDGYGTGGSYGGTSRWNSADGGYATITLSDSVASMWPGAGVQALVAHETGHAILSKCIDLFFDSEFYAGEEESWATAWAIGLGYTADGSGESIYGRPSDGLIELSTQCR